MMLKISINLHQILFVVILIHTVQCKVSLDQDSSSHRHQAANKIKDSLPFLGNFLIEDKCQFDLCGPAYTSEWGGAPGQEPVAGSCSGDCSLLAITLNQNKFHKEFLWSACANMCGKKFPADKFPEYKNRFQCMESCYTAYNKISPHHNIARYCLQAACRALSPDSGHQIDCFEGCAEHVSGSLPETSWRVWARAIAGTCSTTRYNATDILHQRLKCADRQVWEHISKVEKNAEESHASHCLTTICNNQVKCGLSCLEHIHSIHHGKRSEWMTCSTSRDCSNANDWSTRKRCADTCQQNIEEEREAARLNELNAEAARSQLHLYSNTAPLSMYTTTTTTLLHSVLCLATLITGHRFL